MMPVLSDSKLVNRPSSTNAPTKVTLSRYELCFICVFKGTNECEMFRWSSGVGSIQTHMSCLLPFCFSGPSVSCKLLLSIILHYFLLALPLSVLISFTHLHPGCHSLSETRRQPHASLSPVCSCHYTPTFSQHPPLQIQAFFDNKIN